MDRSLYFLHPFHPDPFCFLPMASAPTTGNKVVLSDDGCGEVVRSDGDGARADGNEVVRSDGGGEIARADGNLVVLSDDDGEVVLTDDGGENVRSNGNEVLSDNGSEIVRSDARTLRSVP